MGTNSYISIFSAFLILADLKDKLNIINFIVSLLIDIFVYVKFSRCASLIRTLKTIMRSL